MGGVARVRKDAVGTVDALLRQAARHTGERECEWFVCGAFGHVFVLRFEEFGLTSQQCTAHGSKCTQ